MTTGNPMFPELPVQVEERISIEPDGTVVARSGKVEYGQGIRTTFAKIVAEELAVPIAQIRVELGETDRVPWDFGTFGSLSVATDGKTLRNAAAYARTELLRRAGARFEVPTEELVASDGRVTSRDGRSATYQELVLESPVTGVVLPGFQGGRPVVPIETSAPLRVEARDVVMGRARYVADVRLPNMLRGRVLSPPRAGAKLRALRDEAARAIPGVVRVVREEDFVGVVAERDEQALLALGALEADWAASTEEPAAAVDLTLREDDGIAAAFASAARELTASFHVPHITHTPIGPSAAVADVRADGADVYAGTQRPFGLRDELAGLLSLSSESVRVHPMMASGTYGRNNMGDAAMDATRLSRASGRPVLVQWSRADEFRRGPNRPELDARIRAALDGRGRIVGWDYDVRTNPHTYGGAFLPPQIMAMTSGRNAVPDYDVGSARVVLHVVPAKVRTGAFRSLAAAPNVFAIESFIDELAGFASIDPIEYRLMHVSDPRLRRVLETVRDRSGWLGRKSEPGHGFGVACSIYHGTYVAQVVEVTVEARSGVRLERVWAVADAGRLVHPDGGKNQIEGGIQQAASWTLLEELPHREGAVTASSFVDYPIARFADAPFEIDVAFTSDPGAPSSGLGEPGTVPTAAAIANAVFAATSARVRSLPLSAEAIRGALLA